MKAKTLLLSFSMVMLISSFIVNSEQYELKMKHLENRELLKDGISPHEFDELIVIEKSTNQKIESLTITLARGNRAVKVLNVENNKVDLHQFAQSARPGDRFVIEVKTKNDSTNVAAVFAIKVN